MTSVQRSAGIGAHTIARRAGGSARREWSEMSDEAQPMSASAVSRRGFLKRVAIVGMAASALGLLSRGKIAGVGREGRTLPADLPGAGSIFQPRNDARIQR